MAESPLLLVDIDRTGAFPADQLAFEMGYEAAEVLHGVSDAITLISRRRPSPRYVVADIGLRGEDMLPVLSSLARACDGVAQLVVIGNVNDLGFYRAVKNLGAFEYFIHPASVTEVRKALLHQAPHSRKNAGKGLPGQVIAFMSAASGDGASTVALNMAYAMADETREGTVLVDLDYQFGMIARHLDVQAPFGIRELFDYPERGVDATLVSKMMLDYGDHMNLIAAPDLLRMMPAIRPDTVRDLIGVLKAQFPYVMLDVPHVWSPWTAEALAQADRIVVVSQLWLRSLTHLSRLLAAWGEAGIDRERIMVAINRSGARFREAITPQDFERVCLKTIDFHFVNDIKTVVNAENQGKTVVETGPSPLEKQMREAARTLAGDAAQGREAPLLRRKSGLFGGWFKG